MGKVLAGLLFVGLLAYIGYFQFSMKPLDARQTIDAGIKQVRQSNNLTPEQEGLLRVQLALADFQANNGSPPASLSELVPKYFDSVPQDPSTGKPFDYSRDGNVPRLGAQVGSPVKVAKAGKKKKKGKGEESVDLDLDFVNPNLMQASSFVYNPEGKRDPFIPFDLTPKQIFDPDTPPLQQYHLGQLRLTAVLLDPTKESTAIVEDAGGKGFPVKKGTVMGTNNGVVIKIEKDKLTVLEKYIDFTGKETENVVVLELQK